MIHLPKVVASFSVQKVSSKLRVFWVIQSKVERGNNLSSNKKRQNCLSPLISTEIIQLGLGQTWVPQMSELSDDDSSKKLLVQEFQVWTHPERFGTLNKFLQPSQGQFETSPQTHPVAWLWHWWPNLLEVEKWRILFFDSSLVFC